MLKKMIALCILLLCSSVFSYEINQPVFKIESETHNDFVNQLVLSSDQQLLLTVSSDKTSKLWDLNNGDLIKTYRPYIFSDDYGKICSAALSPSNQFIAVSGELYSPEGDYFVDIFDIESAEVVNTLYGFKNPVDQVLYIFSYDEVALCAGERVYIVNTYNGKTLFAENISGNCTVLLKSERTKTIYCATDLGFIYAFKFGNGSYHLQTVSSKFGGKSIKSMKLSPDGTKHAVVVDGDNLVSVIDAGSLTGLKTLNNAYLSGVLNTVAWSSDSQRIYASGSLRDFGKENVVVYWEYTSPSERKRLFSSEYEILHMEVLNDGSLVYVDTNSKIHRNLFGQELFKPQLGTLENKNGDYALSCSLNGAVVKLLDTRTNQSLFFDVQNLHLFKGNSVNQFTDMTKPKVTDFSLNLVDWKNSSTPKLSYSLLTLDQDEVSRAVSLNRTSNEFLMATSQGVRRYNKNGNLIWKIKTEKEIMGVLITENEDKFITIDSAGLVSWYRYADAQLLASLFIPDSEDSWILFSPLGYFASKGDAESFAGWHINRKWDEAADFYSFNRFFEHFYIPQIPVKSILSLKTDAQQIAELTTSVPVLDVVQRAPVVEIEVESTETEKETVHVSAFADGGVEAVDDIVLSVNGKVSDTIENSQTDGNRMERSWDVPLIKGSNEIEVYAVNESGVESERNKVTVFRRGVDVKNGDLYIISSGVSRYQDSDLNLAYARKDSVVFSEFIQEKGSGLYDDVYTYTYNDEKALKESIKRVVKDLNEKMKPEDTLILFFSGHGFIDNSDPLKIQYALAYHKINLYNLQSGMTTEELEQLIKSVKAQNVAVVLDACNSENAIDSERLRVAFINKTAKTIAKKTGISVFMSSAKDQSSFESALLKQGVFTYAFINSVKEKGIDQDEDGVIQSQELADILDVIVPEISVKYCSEVQIPHNFVLGKDFSLFLK